MNAAYLYATLDKTMFMQPPAGFLDLWGDRLTARERELVRNGGVLRLNKSLYGLKQSGRLWYETLRAHIESKHGAKATATEPCVFVGPGFILLIYVDDGVIMSASKATIDAFFKTFSAAFDIKRLGFPRYLTGWAVSRADNGTLSITQKGYCLRLGETFASEGARAKAIPLSPGVALDTDGPPGDRQLYMECIGSLLFAAVGTRPDVSAAVSMLSRYMQAPTKAHVALARNVCTYLAATSELCLRYTPNSAGLNIEVYADASFTPDEHARKSRTGWVIMVNGARCVGVRLCNRSSRTPPPRPSISRSQTRRARPCTSSAFSASSAPPSLAPLSFTKTIRLLRGWRRKSPPKGASTSTSGTITCATWSTPATSNYITVGRRTCSRTF